MAVEVGLGLKELGVVALGAAIDAPINIADGIPRHVLAVVGEFSTEALERTAVLAHAQALDDFTGDHLQIPKLLQKLGLEVVGL